MILRAGTSRIGPLQQCLVLLLFAGSLYASVFIYAEGLNAGFFLDDYPNLAQLNLLNHRWDAGHVYRYLTSGLASQLGRPIAMASFLINAQDWPNHPSSFQYTNICIHLLNGVLLFWLLHRFVMLHRAHNTVAILFVPPAVMTLWLLHPLNVSTTLYTVQRMNSLSTLFTLAALVSYLYMRPGITKPSLLQISPMLAVLGVFGILGILSKENAILLVALLLVLELYGAINGLFDRSKALQLLFGTGTAAIILGILLNPRFLKYGNRDFSLGERLLTESRVLLEYLYKILIPNRYGTGLHHDDFPLSRGWMDPPETLLAVVVLLLLIAVALWALRKGSVWGLGMMWFFAGHLLESTSLPLEIYFEHRNYLPMVGPLLAIAWTVFGIRLRYRRLLIPPFILYGLLTAYVTMHNVNLWGNRFIAAEIWVSEHPRSVRAAQHAGVIWLKAGRPANALAKITPLIELFPNHATLALQSAFLKCLVKKSLSGQEFEQLKFSLENGTHDLATGQALHQLFLVIKKTHCGTIDEQNFALLIDHFKRHPGSRNDRYYSLYNANLLAEISLYFDDLDSAIHYLRIANQKKQTPEQMLLLTRLLIQADRLQEARIELGQTDAMLEKPLFGIERFLRQAVKLRQKLDTMEQTRQRQP